MSSDRPYLGVAQAAVESGDYAMAESIFARASVASPTDGGLQLRYADVLVRESKISQARDVLTQHLSTVSDPQLLHGALGAVYVLQGEPAQAITEFNALKGHDPRWTVNKAVALDMLGRHAEAQALYQVALAAAPDDVVVINDLSLSLLLSGQTAEAARIAAPLAGRADLSSRVKSGLGVVLAANGDIAGARQVIDAGVSDEQLGQITTAIHKIGN